MVVRHLLIVIILLSTWLSFSQEDKSLGTALYIELGGKGFASANADFSLGPKSRLTIGLTMLDHEFAKEEDEEEYPTMTLPTPGVMYLHLLGKEKHFFEAGAGFSISPVPWRTYSENDSPLTIHGSLGYRYQAPNKFFFRAGFTPFYRVKWMFLPLIGVSLGYSW